MLHKSLSSNADSLAYDLEDSVAHAQKPKARRQVATFLDVRSCYNCKVYGLPTYFDPQGDRVASGERAVRINAVGTGFEQDDLEAVVRTHHPSSQRD